jgi:hypothetical protein
MLLSLTPSITCGVLLRDKARNSWRYELYWWWWCMSWAAKSALTPWLLKHLSLTVLSSGTKLNFLPLLLLGSFLQIFFFSTCPHPEPQSGFQHLCFLVPELSLIVLKYPAHSAGEKIPVFLSSLQGTLKASRDPPWGWISPLRLTNQDRTSPTLYFAPLAKGWARRILQLHKVMNERVL